MNLTVSESIKGQQDILHNAAEATKQASEGLTSLETLVRSPLVQLRRGCMLLWKS